MNKKHLLYFIEKLTRIANNRAQENGESTNQHIRAFNDLTAGGSEKIKSEKYCIIWLSEVRAYDGCLGTVWR